MTDVAYEYRVVCDAGGVAPTHSPSDARAVVDILEAIIPLLSKQGVDSPPPWQGDTPPVPRVSGGCDEGLDEGGDGDEPPLAPAPSAVEYIGPFSHHEVLVGGRSIPFVTATPLAGGRVCLTLDGRYDLDLTLQDAERIVPFLADAIAVALGFSAHPHREWEQPVPRPPFPRWNAIELGGS